MTSTLLLIDNARWELRPHSNVSLWNSSAASLPFHAFNARPTKAFSCTRDHVCQASGVGQHSQPC
jgi:hypothetical protein